MVDAAAVAEELYRELLEYRTEEKDVYVPPRPRLQNYVARRSSLRNVM